MPEIVPLRQELFIEDTNSVKLIGNRCKSCGLTFFPKAETICLNCCNEQLEDTALGPKGTLYSYTTCEVPTVHYQPPYTVGLVYFKESDIRVFGQLVPVDGKPFEIDMEMEVVLDKLWQEDGREVVGYKFKPV